MTNTGRCSGFAHKSTPGQFVANESGVDDLQRYRTPKIDIDCFVGHPHRTTAQLDGHPIFVGEDLVVLEPQLGTQKSWLNRRLADCRLIAESTA